MPDLANTPKSAEPAASLAKTLEARSIESAENAIITPDQLDYMADLMTELQEMALRSRMETLATILGLAVGEAGRQMVLLRRY